MRDDRTEIPIGEEFGFNIANLINPQSTRPSEPFFVTISDSDERLIVELTQESALLEDFVMQATQPSSIIFAEVNTDIKQALEPTMIQMRIIT